MPSLQNSAPGAKSMKFQNALNAFKPFLAQPGDEPEEEDSTPLTREFDTRLRLDKPSSMAMGSRPQQQHYQYQNPTPTPAAAAPQNNQGSWYQEKTTNEEKGEDENSDNEEGSDDSDSDGEFDYLLDDDDEDKVLQAIREKRMKELMKEQAKEAEQKAAGHGEVRSIVQDEFLSECTSSQHVVVHFFHKDFERCKIMDHHLKIIAENPQHLSCKFVRIDAEKAPFFVAKLKIKTLPTVIIFKDGQTVDRKLGFEGLTDAASGRRANDIDNFPTSRLGYWLESVGAIEYDGPDSDDEDNDDKRKTALRGRHQSRAYDEDI